MNVVELGKKDIKRIIEKLKEMYNLSEKFSFLISDFRWFISKKERKIYIINKETTQVLKSLGDSVVKYGLYIARIEKDGIRFSIEGSQLFGPFSKRVIKLDITKLLSNNLLEVEGECGYYIIRDLKRNYFSGTIKIASSGKILDFIPKNRKFVSKSK